MKDGWKVKQNVDAMRVRTDRIITQKESDFCCPGVHKHL